MKYFLDTGDLKELDFWSRRLNLSGVTTNPSLLNYETSLPMFLEMSVMLEIPKIFIQVDSEKLIEKCEHCDRIVWKVSMYPEYYSLIKHLKVDTIKGRTAEVAATTVYDMVQLNQAVEMECQYSMIYLAKNENPYFLEEAVQRFGNSKTKLIAASFRTKNDVVRAIKSGIWGATIPPRVLELAFKNELVERDLS